jgi:hypothetical protein
MTKAFHSLLLVRYNRIVIPREQLLDKLEILQNIYVARSTHGPTDEQEYKQLRHDLLDDGRLGSRLPRFVRTSRTLDQFWMFIKPKFATYDERRQYIAEQFRPLVDELEGHDTGAEEQVESALKSLSADAVSLAWRKALERQATDPEGAITAARTLLESVCKHILDDARQEYGTDADLPKLYRLTAEHLKIAPSQHSESIFKQILGGCTAVVEGLGSLRNRVGDAHGQGRRAVRPSSRHARLAVNLAGGMSMFLAETWQERNSSQTLFDRSR